MTTQKKEKAKAPKQQPAWLFPPSENNPVLNPQPLDESKIQQQKESRAEALDFLNKKAVNVPFNRTAPHPLLLNLIGTFLTEYGFHGCCRLYSIERKARTKIAGWDNTTGQKVPKGLRLVNIFKEFYATYQKLHKDELEIYAEFDSRSKANARKEEKALRLAKASQSKQKDSSGGSDETSSSGSEDSSEESETDEDESMEDAKSSEVKEAQSTRSSKSLVNGVGDSDSSSTSSDSDADDESDAPRKSKAVKSEKPRKEKKAKMEKKLSSNNSELTQPKTKSVNDTSKTSKSIKQTSNTAQPSSSSSSESNDTSSASSSDPEPEKTTAKVNTINPLERLKDNLKGARANSSDSSSTLKGDAGLNDVAAPVVPNAVESASSSSDTSSPSSSSDSSISEEAKSASTKSTKGGEKATRKRSRSPASAVINGTMVDEAVGKAAKKQKKQNEPFSRINSDAISSPQTKLLSNKYVPYDYAERAHRDLVVTKGKGFTKEKNKKKRGSYRGGAIDIEGKKGIKFDE